MSYEKIVNDYIKNSTAYKAFLKNQNVPISVDTIDFFPLSVLVKDISDKRGGRVFAIASTDDYAKGLYEDLSYVNDTDVILLPSDGKQLYSEYTSSRQEEERRRLQAQQAIYREQKRCQYCGGEFKKVLIFSKCSKCGKMKDY